MDLNTDKEGDIMNAKKLLTTLAVSAVLFTGCGLKSGETIIKVNNTNISQSEFDKIFDKQVQNSMFAKLGLDMKDRNNFLYYMTKERIVNELIVRTLIEQEIAKRGIKVTNDDVEDAIKDIIDKLGSKEQLDQVLKQNNVSAADFKRDLKEEVKLKKLAQNLGAGSVNDAEAKAFYDKNKDKFKNPEKVRASHILITANPEEIKEIIMSDEANKNLTPEQITAKVNEQLNAKKVKADKLLAEVKQNPAAFAKLAKENSEDTTSAEKGGDLGFFAAHEMVPEFSKAAFAMKPNTVSPNLVKSQFGYHIIMVVDRMAASQDSFEKANSEIKAYLENQKQLEAIDKLVESLKKTAQIDYVNSEYNPENIKKSLQDVMQKSADEEAAKEKAKKEQTKAPVKTPDKK